MISMPQISLNLLSFQKNRSQPSFQIFCDSERESRSKSRNDGANTMVTRSGYSQ